MPYEKFADGTSKDLSDEIPFDIPESWQWVRLSDLGSFVGGHTPSLSDASNWADGDILWVTSKDMKQKYISDTGCKVSKKGASELHLLPKGSLIMVTRSGILRRTFPIAIASKPLTINQDQRGIEFYNSEMSEYIYCCLKSFEPIILRDYRKTGTTVESIIWDKFIHIPIPLPPLAEQKRIVAKVEELFAYADQIGSASEEITKTAQRLDKKILDLAIRGKLVPQDPNDEPARDLVKRIEAARNEKTGSKKSRAAASHKPTYEIEPPFTIPESWQWVRLGDVFNHNTGKALNRNNAEGILREYITTSNVYWDEFKLDELKQMPFTDEELNKCTVRKGDLLVCEGGDIGRAAIWNFNKEVCIQNHLHRLRAYSEVCVPYFCFVLRLYKATNRLQGKGIGLQGFSSGMLHNLIVPLPPLAEQKRIVAKIEELRAMTRTLTM